VILLFLFFVSTNFLTISSEAKAYFAKDRSGPQYVVLGEIDLMADYMISNTSGKEAYFTGNNDYFWNYYKPLMYICSQRGFTLLRGDKSEKVPPGAVLFAAAQNADSIAAEELNHRQVVDYKDFGQIGIYRLEN
jgi:hypothetical protein